MACVSPGARRPDGKTRPAFAKATVGSRHSSPFSDAGNEGGRASLLGMQPVFHHGLLAGFALRRVSSGLVFLELIDRISGNGASRNRACVWPFPSGADTATLIFSQVTGDGVRFFAAD
jgi:hypothetical protein